MKLAGSGGAHLTYCTNVHAGESWSEVQHQLERLVADVKQRICPERPFGVGLRLSAQAVFELLRPAELERLNSLLAAHDLYVFTMNGFPYGRFHGEPIKTRVYEPDWLEEERLVYTNALADVLSGVLPAGCKGSISTVPGAFREKATSSDAPWQMARRMLDHLLHSWRIEQHTGKQVVLALEPEPRCFLETTQEAVTFIQEQLLGTAARRYVAQQTGIGGDQAEALVRRHVGLCLDACHAAVEFEDVVQSLRLAKSRGIQIAKAQLSCGLRLFASPQAVNALSQFDDPIYLHQVVVNRDGALQRMLDLPEALAQQQLVNASAEWRVHFHVPIFLDQLGVFSTTQATLRELLAEQSREPFTDHLEVETYTWSVLPEVYARGDVCEDVARELRWVMSALPAPARS